MININQSGCQRVGYTFDEIGQGFLISTIRMKLRILETFYAIVAISAIKVPKMRYENSVGRGHAISDFLLIIVIYRRWNT